MSASTIEVTCPHCGGALVVQRAAPADAQLRIVCSRCEAVAPVGDRVMQTLVIGRPVTEHRRLRLVA